MTRAALLMVLVAACDPGVVVPDGPRYMSAERKVSLVEPDGWTRSEDRGALLYRSDPMSEAPRATILVRSVAKTGEWNVPRDAGMVVPETERWLRALPRAEVSGAVAVHVPGLFARAFDLTYLPPGATGRYARRHVVLVGQERVFHVIHTAPVGELDWTAGVFAGVLQTVKEEV